MQRPAVVLSPERLLRVVEIQNEIVATRLDLVEVMRLVAERASELTAADAGAVEIPEGEEMVYRATSTTAAAHVGLRLPIDTSAVGAVSMVCVPLRHGETLVGVLKVYAARPDAFGSEDVALLEHLSAVIAAHITNAREFERIAAESRRHRSHAIAGLRALARAIDAKDPITRQHSDRVAQLACAIARRLGWCDEQLQLLHEAALLHDVGKLGIADAILLKPGKLSADEYAQVKRHAALGATILDGVLADEQVQWVRWHHERPDGHGYPDELSESSIPDGAAIIALADAWDVMTVSRPYSPPLEPIKALRECRVLAGRQFRADLVEILAKLI